MAEPSLLCVSCARPPPPHRRTWGRCTVCVARNLPSTYYCGEECMNAHWQNGHKEWHKAQKESAKAICEGGQPERNRLIAEAQARRAEVTGSEYDKRFAAALALNAKVDHNAAAKAWRKIIKEWPDEPEAYHNLANVVSRSCRDMEAVPIYLKAMELHEDGQLQRHRPSTCSRPLPATRCRSPSGGTTRHSRRSRRGWWRWRPKSHTRAPCERAC